MCDVLRRVVGPYGCRHDGCSWLRLIPCVDVGIRSVGKNRMVRNWF